MIPGSGNEETALGRRRGLVQTDLHCTDCTRNFLARIDYRINGDHVIVCPFCGHQHCRKIKDGVATESRWETRNNLGDNLDLAIIVVPAHRILKLDSQPIVTGAASAFMRDRWLNRSDAGADSD